MPPRQPVVPAVAVIESRKAVKRVRFALPDRSQKWTWEGAPVHESGVSVLRDGPELPEQEMLEALIEFQDGSETTRRVAVQFVH